MPVKITLSKDKPEDPKADFMLKIDFIKGIGPASRVFVAAQEMIDALQAFDHALVRSIDSSIQTVMALEEVEAGSIKIWLKNLLTSVDDQAIKELDWKQLVGAYLVKAKYVMIKWLDSDTDQKSIVTLGQELRLLASETDVRYLPDYSAPEPKALLAVAEKMQAAKNTLLPDDRMFLSAGGEELEFNLNTSFSAEDMEAIATKETLIMPSAPMIMAVKKPDYLGSSQWQLRIGKKNIAARIDDADWLQRFQNREVDVRPGDALKCEVSVEMRYGFDNELLSEVYKITKVIDVMVNEYKQSDWLDDVPERKERPRALDLGDQDIEV